ncbi:MAG TPA: DUF6062 family protein [Ktedonobacteraceae bacterium]|nr:DUF6062 family protein [Ktedonobacteraceae bacterium]
MRKEDVVVHPSRDADSLCAAFKREGCPICTVVLEHMDMAMNTWNYEGFTDVEHRHTLIRSGGFCPLHTWQLAQRNNAFQLALIYREVLTDFLATLDRNETQQQVAVLHRPGREPGWKTWLSKWFQPKTAQFPQAVELYARCPLCRTRANIEQRVTEVLIEQLQLEEIRTLLCQSTGLCRQHFMQTSRMTLERSPQQQQVLIACQQACLQRTLEEVKELIRKHDYHAATESRGDEMTAWRRAAEFSVGNPGIR